MMRSACSNWKRSLMPADPSCTYKLTGEAYLKKDIKPIVAIYYQKACSTNEGNKNAADILETLMK